MLLQHLLEQFDPTLSWAALPNIEVRGVREDSRLVRAADLFIARPGGKSDGARFIEEARTRGAVAIVTQSWIESADLPQIVTRNIVTAASRLANILYAQPSETVRVLGITGTNGKTTTAYLIRHILAKQNIRCGMVGTVEIDDGRSRRPADMTTPGACDIAELLGAMRDNGTEACAIEVSSHALDQGRVAGVKFAGAAFTNLTGDHLDYHKTMDHYAGAKAKLFEALDAGAVAAVNADDQASDRMILDCGARILRFGFGTSADYRARDGSSTIDGTTFTLQTPDGNAGVRMPLVGKHNIENALAAATLAGDVFHLSAEQIADALSDAHGAPGRLQMLRCGQPFAVLVDYAHTDDALENVLTALRPLTRGKLRVLFGCGGDRDPSKRPRMARVAENLADAVYITSDNPRTEDPHAILEQITAGLSSAARRDLFIEADRRTAISRIIADAREDDVVLIAGKGHENYQDVMGQKHHFDDVEEAETAIRSGTAAAVQSSRSWGHRTGT